MSAGWLEAVAGTLRSGAPALLVHVAAVEGSAPREAGACMVVTGDDGAAPLAGTIGGGQLEYEAIARARRLLAAAAPGTVERIPLGPDLGQCCGGAVTLAFEPFAPADLAWIERLVAAAAGPRPAFRSLEIAATGIVARELLGESEPSAADDWRAAARAAAAAGRGYHAEVGSGAQVRLVERLGADVRAVWLFGAGHVGRAVVRALAPLPFAVTWVDGRDDPFPGDVPQGVRTIASAMPELLVDEAPAGALYLVMTHSHPLDERICAAVLARGDAGYLGLIGSRTKRARFVSRLARAGLGEAARRDLVCPIGLPQIAGKDPAVIAASLAADLLARTGALQPLPDTSPKRARP